MKNRAEILLVFSILALSFFLRLRILDEGANYHLNDTHRDYLIASRIVRYHEFPLRGPAGYTKNLLPASPLYFYLTAGALWVNNSIMALGVWQIFADLLFATCIYLLARMLFGRLTAALALLFTAFADCFLYLAILPWQHSIVPPSTYFAYLLFYLSYLTKRAITLGAGVVLFVVSVAISPSGTIAAIPLVGIFLYILWRRRVFSTKHIITACGTGVFVAIIIFIIPYLVRVFQGTVTTDSWAPGQLMTLWQHASDPGLLPRVWDRTLTFLQFFLPDQTKTQQATIQFFFISVTAAALYSALLSPKRENKQRLFVLLAGSILLIIASFFVWSATVFPYYFFVPALGLFVIAAAHVIAELLKSKKLTAQLFAVVLILLTARTFFPSLQELLGETVLSLQNKQLFSPRYHPDPAMGAIAKEIRRIKTDDRKAAYDFFEFKTYFHNPQTDVYTEYLWDNEHFWIGLEQELNARLVAIDDAQDLGWRPIGPAMKPYLFLVCKLDEQKERGVNLDRCIAPFLSSYPKYKVTRTIFEDEIHAVHLARTQSF